MNAVVPASFLFRFSLPVKRVTGIPKKGRKLLALPKSCQLDSPAQINDTQQFGEVRIAWNEDGLGISAEVKGKQQPLECDSRRPTEADGLQVWIDTRNTQTIHRAGRFCHHFCLLPTQTTGKSRKPMGEQLPIVRAREESTICNSADIQVAADVTSTGYLLDAWLPKSILTGFENDSETESASQRQLGFYYWLRDSELGHQFLSVGQEFPFSHDPSLWTTLELIG